MRNNEKADNSNDAQLLKVKQLAFLLNVGVRTVWRYDKQQKIPAPLKIGRSKRWDKRDIDLWLKLGCPNRKKFNRLKKEGTSNG